jgi:hypothetical protein
MLILRPASRIGAVLQPRVHAQQVQAGDVLAEHQRVAAIGDADLGSVREALRREPLRQQKPRHARHDAMRVFRRRVLVSAVVRHLIVHATTALT